MLTQAQLEKYKKQRSIGVHPIQAKRMAEGTYVQEKFDWGDADPGSFWVMKTKEMTSEGEVDITVRIVNDDSPDLSWIGTFYAHEMPGAENWHRFDRVPEWNRHNIMGWFLPQFTYDELITDMRGMSKNDAHLKARAQVAAQMEQMREIETGDSHCVGIVATVHLDGVELGDDSCWGYIFNPSNDDHWDYINDSAREVMDVAVAMATADLCPTCHGSGRKKADG